MKEEISVEKEIEILQRDNSEEVFLNFLEGQQNPVFLKVILSPKRNHSKLQLCSLESAIQRNKQSKNLNMLL